MSLSVGKHRQRPNDWMSLVITQSESDSEMGLLPSRFPPTRNLPWLSRRKTKEILKGGQDKDSLPQKKHKYRIKKMEILSGRDGGGGAKVSPVRLD